jgi:hypothetical protein
MTAWDWTHDRQTVTPYVLPLSESVSNLAALVGSLWQPHSAS